MPDQSGAAKVAELAKDIRIGMLTTLDKTGQMISRPMALQDTEFDGDFWFFAERASRKIEHIGANPSVNVTLASGQTWISVHGHARVVEDPAKAKELWNTAVEAWFPQGPEDAERRADQGRRRRRRVLGHPGRTAGDSDQLRQGQGDRTALRRRRERAGLAMTSGSRRHPAALGDTEAAGAGLSDDQFAERVAGQTSSDLQAEDVFEREADAASTDEPIADVTGDDLQS